MRILELKHQATYCLVYAPDFRPLHAPQELKFLHQVELQRRQQLVCRVQTPGTPWQPLCPRHQARLLALDDWLWRLAAIPTDVRVLIATPTVALPKRESGLPIVNPFSNVIFDSDFRSLFYQSRDELLRVSLPKGEAISSSDGFGYFAPVLLASSVDDRWLAGLVDGTLIVCRDLKASKETRALPHDSQRVVALAFTADGRQPVSATQRAVYLWDVARQQQKKCFEVEGSKLVDMAVQPSGPLLVTAHADHTVTLRERDTGRVLRRYDWKIGPLHGVAFAPDGLTASALGENGQLFVWDADLD